MDPIYEWFEERSAIMQFDGGLNRSQADYAAYALTVAYCRRTGQSLPSEGYLGALRPRSELVWSDELCAVREIKPRPDWILWTNEDE
jgi:hypothetical protein